MNVFEIVTDKVIEALKAGTVAWRKPWVARTGQPMNLTSKRPYRGINVWLLALRGFSSPYWLTFNQVRTLKGQVTKGEKGTVVVFWKRLEQDTTRKNKSLKASDRDYFFMLRYYTVFNVEQCTGLDKHIPKAAEQVEFKPIEAADAVMALALKNGLPTIQHVGAVAAYNPTSDVVIMPPKESFKTNEGYYTTCFHELGHATGHSSRLGRDIRNVFGGHEYSKEELIAEMTSTFIMATCGLTGTFDNSVAYIQNWIKVLSSDPKMVVMAAAAAQRAVDYIQNGKQVEEAEEEE